MGVCTEESTEDSVQPPRALQVRVGPVRPLGTRATPSGYDKQPVSGPVRVGRGGLTGDAQADLRAHGGPDKAVYLYPADHYSLWRNEHPRHAARLIPGAFGENIPYEGALTERQVCIGDRYRIGGAVVIATQPRQPCFKIGLYFNDPSLVRAMTRTGRCGWYAAVLVEGDMQAGDALELIDRPNPAWSIHRFAEMIAARALTIDLVKEMIAMPGLAESWRLRALKILTDVGRGGGALVGPEGLEPPT